MQPVVGDGNEGHQLQGPGNSTAPCSTVKGTCQGAVGPQSRNESPLHFPLQPLICRTPLEKLGQGRTRVFSMVTAPATAIQESLPSLGPKAPQQTHSLPSRDPGAGSQSPIPDPLGDIWRLGRKGRAGLNPAGSSTHLRAPAFLTCRFSSFTSSLGEQILADVLQAVGGPLTLWEGLNPKSSGSTWPIRPHSCPLPTITLHTP